MISVIVPVHNNEKYLNKCFESILNSTFKDFELILVDDGSTDSAPQICDEYAEKDSRIVVIHKENGRAASARNTGIKIAKGEYLSFIDCDDWIEPEMLEAMYSKAVEYNCDIVMCDIMKRGKREYKITQPVEGGYYDRKKIEKELFPSLIMFENIEFPITISNCVMMTKRCVFEDNNILYDEDIHYCEDALMGPKLLYNCNGFYYMKDSCFYNYRLNENSTSQSYRPEKWNHYLEINHRLKEYFGKDKEFDFSRQIKINLLYFVFSAMGNVLGSNEDKKFKKKTIKEIMNNEEVRALFKNFKIPDVNLGLKLTVYMVKYRLVNLYLLYTKIR